MSLSQITKKITQTGMRQRAGRRIIKPALVTAACASLLLSPLSFADEPVTWFGDTADGEWLAGIKLGVAQPDLSGYDNATMGTLVVGYQFARPIGDRGTSSVEMEVGFSNTPDIQVNGVNGAAEYDLHTFGVFFNYRSPGTVYFKGKLGVVDSNIDTRYPDGSKAREKLNDTAIAFGLGAGVRLGGSDGRTTIEAEWVSASGDNDINYYNLGGTIEF